MFVATDASIHITSPGIILPKVLKRAVQTSGSPDKPFIKEGSCVLIVIVKMNSKSCIAGDAIRASWAIAGLAARVTRDIRIVFVKVIARD